MKIKKIIEGIKRDIEVYKKVDCPNSENPPESIKYIIQRIADLEYECEEINFQLKNIFKRLEGFEKEEQ